MSSRWLSTQKLFPLTIGIERCPEGGGELLDLASSGEKEVRRCHVTGGRAQRPGRCCAVAEASQVSVD
jgi:hypothetical protein